jgi:hypothetical protein
MFTTNSISHLLAFFVVGLGAALMGLICLFRPSKAVTSCRNASFASLGLALFAAAALCFGEVWLSWGLAALSVTWLGLTFLRTTLPGKFFALLAIPRVQGGLLALLGLALLGGIIYQIDANLQAEIDESEQRMGRELSAVDLELAGDRKALTDSGATVNLWRMSADNTPTLPEHEALFLREHSLDLQLIQLSSSDSRSNCHGWVFTAGQHWVRGGDVPQILRDNGYQSVSRPAIGDIAIFRDGGDQVTHTALVRAIREDGMVLLESKWGKLGTYIHTASRHVYTAHQMTYYHTSRGTHLLRGLADQHAHAPLAPLQFTAQ